MTPHDHRTFVPGCYRCELGRDEAHDAEVEELRELLEDVAASGVAWDDSRLAYVDVQIERPVWEALRAWFSEKGPRA